MEAKRILIVAVGGQGNLFIARILGEAAIEANVDVKMSEFHGMAQRGGVVESMVLLGGVKSYCISDGRADVLLGFEPSETIRAAHKCNSQSIIVTNTAPLPPFTVALGKAKYPDISSALSVISGRIKRLIALNATDLALQAGSVLSMNIVMLGALVGCRELPIPSETIENGIRKNTKGPHRETNLRAFSLGMEATAKLI